MKHETLATFIISKGLLWEECEYTIKVVLLVPLFKSLLAHLTCCLFDLVRYSILLHLGDLVHFVSRVQTVGASLTPEPRCVPAPCRPT